MQSFRRCRPSIGSVLTVLLIACPAAAGDQHVDYWSGDDSNDGTSWQRAKLSVQAAIEAAAATGGGTVRISAGVFGGRPEIDRMPAITLEGGYPPGGGPRDLFRHQTIIRGGIDVLGSADTVLDGLTLTRGTGWITPFFNVANVGGGLAVVRSDRTIVRNCKIVENTVFAFEVDYDPSWPCTNVGAQDGLGAGVFVWETTGAVLENNLVARNTIDYSDAGCTAAFYRHGSGISGWNVEDLTIRNCTVVENASEPLLGRGVEVSTTVTATIVVTDNIFWGNTGGGDVDYVAGPYGEPQHSLVGSGGPLPPSSFSGDPLFVVGPYSRYSLAHRAAGDGADSPCIDAGSGRAVDRGLESGSTRRDGLGDVGTADLGFHAPGLGAPVLRVEPGAIRLVNPRFGVRWDVVRGDLEDVRRAHGVNTTVPLTCVASDVVPASVTDATLPSDLGVSATFYLVRHAGGTYGTASDGVERVPGPGDCVP